MPPTGPQDASPASDRPSDVGKTLRAGEERFRLLVESVVDYGIFMLDSTGIVTSWNPGAQRMQQYEASEIVGQHFSRFYPSEVVASGKCELELETAEREGRFEEEGWRLRKDGTRFWANVVISPVRDPSGGLLGFGKVTRDLSERQRSLEALRRSEERLRLLVAAVTDYAIFVLDPLGHVATWNPGAERLKGYTAEEIIGRHFSVFYPEIDVREGKCEMELTGALRDGRFEDEGWRVRKDGSSFWANVVITPIVDDKNTLLGFAKVTRDLSERKQYEDERERLARAEAARRTAEENQLRTESLAESLREARDKAEQATRMKDEFLATVSHELRTPLSAILGWGRMLQSGSVTPDKLQQAHDSIVRNALAQSKIIEDLLDVSRIIAGQLRLDIDFVDIPQVVSAALEVVRPAADAKGVRLELQLDPDMAAIKGDQNRLQQALWNLLTNAVKFTPRGGLVRVTLQRKESTVQIEVADTGQGFAPSFVPRLFDRFAQEDSGTARRTGGLGLGLPIVKHIIELHGGTVSGHSPGEGQGASFVVTLQAAPVVAARVSAAADREELTTPSELEGVRILVLDDELDACELARTVLERAKAVVEIAHSAQQALELVRTRRPDVIVSDIGMPDEDGYSFIQRLRALPREQGGRTPAVALTAFARAEDRKRALLAGFQNHTTKPIEPQELLLVVANLVNR